jgi:hypothetical protein
MYDRTYLVRTSTVKVVPEAGLAICGDCHCVAHPSIVSYLLIESEEEEWSAMPLALPSTRSEEKA